jgi:hypothetical protein
MRSTDYDLFRRSVLVDVAKVEEILGCGKFDFVVRGLEVALEASEKRFNCRAAQRAAS